VEKFSLELELSTHLVAIGPNASRIRKSNTLLILVWSVNRKSAHGRSRYPGIWSFATAIDEGSILALVNFVELWARSRTCSSVPEGTAYPPQCS